MEYLRLAHLGEQFSRVLNVIRDASFHRRRDSQLLVNPAEGEVERRALELGRWSTRSTLSSGGDCG